MPLRLRGKASEYQGRYALRTAPCPDNEQVACPGAFALGGQRGLSRCAALTPYRPLSKLAERAPP